MTILSSAILWAHKQTKRGYMMNKTNRDLYENSEFAEWLKTKPENVAVDYSPYSVDNYGTRVSVTFWIEDDENGE